MKMINKAMRGVSFLLCLGFLLSANNVWADETCTPISTKEVSADKAQKKNNSDSQDLYEKMNKLGFSCNAAQTALGTFGTKANAYVVAIEAWNAEMNGVKSACNKYSKIKDEYSKCLCGQKEVKVSSATSAYKAMTDAETARDTALTAAKAAIEGCKQTNKDSTSADKTADKAES